jgi:predicted nucleic acid-binding protein
MTEFKFNEMAWSMVRSLNDINRAITSSVTNAQERNVRFAQGVFENSMAVLRSHTDAARELAEEIVEKPDRQAEIMQALVNTQIAAYDRNLRLAQSIFNDGIEVLKNSALDARSLTQEMVQETQRQQEQFQDLTQAFTRAYVDFLRLPLTYYRQTLNKTTSVA